MRPVYQGYPQHNGSNNTNSSSSNQMASYSQSHLPSGSLIQNRSTNNKPVSKIQTSITDNNDDFQNIPKIRLQDKKTRNTSNANILSLLKAIQLNQSLDSLNQTFDHQLINQIAQSKLIYINNTSKQVFLNVDPNDLTNMKWILPTSNMPNNSIFQDNDAYTEFVNLNVNSRLDSSCFQCHQNITEIIEPKNISEFSSRVVCSKCPQLVKTSQNQNHTSKYCQFYNDAVQNLVKASGILSDQIFQLFDHKNLPFYSVFIVNYLNPKDLLGYNWIDLNEFFYAIRQLVHNVVTYPITSVLSNHNQLLIEFFKAISYIEKNLLLVESCPNCYCHEDYKGACKYHHIVMCDSQYLGFGHFPCLVYETEKNTVQGENPTSIPKITIKFLDKQEYHKVYINQLYPYEQYANSYNTDVNITSLVQKYNGFGYSSEFYLGVVPSSIFKAIPDYYRKMIEQEINEEEICCVCKKNSGEFSCGACLERHYCSTDCQVLDWNSHRFSCKSENNKSQQQNQTQNQSQDQSKTQNQVQNHSSDRCYSVYYPDNGQTTNDQNNSYSYGQTYNSSDNQINNNNSQFTYTVGSDQYSYGDRSFNNYNEPSGQNKKDDKKLKKSGTKRKRGESENIDGEHQTKLPLPSIPVEQLEETNFAIQDNERMTCSLCQKKYSNKGNLKSHLRIVHKLSVKEIDEMIPTVGIKGQKLDKDLPDSAKMQCPICQQYYRSRGNLRVHLKGTHKLGLEEARKYLPRNPNRKIMNLADKFHCALCDKYYTTKQSLRLHNKTQHPHLVKAGSLLHGQPVGSAKEEKVCRYGEEQGQLDIENGHQINQNQDCHKDNEYQENYLENDQNIYNNYQAYSNDF